MFQARISSSIRCHHRRRKRQQRFLVRPSSSPSLAIIQFIMILSIVLSRGGTVTKQHSFMLVSSLASQKKTSKIAVVGGGASGIFASIAAAEQLYYDSPETKIVVLEATSKTLSKVKISGGGRCNVMHDTSKTIPTILAGYPRGSKELNGLYHKRFTPTMARDWFEYRGVELKTESDGRMFPTTDSSQTIIDTLLNAAVEAGVDIRKKQKVVSIQPPQDDTPTFEIHYKDDTVEEFNAVIMATGSAPSGWELVQSLGHDLVKPVPSLFTLNCKHDIKEDGLLHGLSGLSVPNAKVSLSKKNFQEGPLLVTHHGISGPAALRLSAFFAREFHEQNYRGPITINWDIPALGTNEEKLFEQLWQITKSNPKKTISGVCPVPGNNIPRRLWSALIVKGSGIPENTVWGNAPKKSVRKLATNLVAFPLEVTGKGAFKEEFVTAGGVPLKEINMKSMESKVVPGVFMCGELINVDGVTGGYNFMNCWSTGYVAGHAAANHFLKSRVEETSSPNA